MADDLDLLDDQLDVGPIEYLAAVTLDLDHAARYVARGSLDAFARVLPASLTPVATSARDLLTASPAGVLTAAEAFADVAAHAGHDHPDDTSDVRTLATRTSLTFAWVGGDVAWAAARWWDAVRTFLRPA